MTAVQKRKKRKLKRLLKNLSIEKLVSLKIEAYFRKVKELKEDNLYPHVIEATERALIKSVLKNTANNQLKASNILGINRNTLRKKIEDLKIKIG